MSRPESRSFEAAVLAREVLGPHLVRIEVGTPAGFASTGIPDEWVAVTVPGQFQTRYYTVRSCTPERIVLDVVVHDEGLVTGWTQGECLGDVLGLSQPKGSFELPAGATWIVLVGDLTALPAIARIGESATLPVTAYVESPDGAVEGYTDLPVTWVAPPAPGENGLADLVKGLSWPEGEGYFWMAGESAQMRDIRRYVRHELGMPASAYDVMGYWSGSRGRRARAVDPRPIYERGKAEGKSDEQIWAAFEQAQDAAARDEA